MVTVIVEPCVQPVVAKSNNPCGKASPSGAVPGCGLAGSPVTGMKRAVANVQVGPPPVKLAVIGPLPVADAHTRGRILRGSARAWPPRSGGTGARGRYAGTAPPIVV